MKLNYPEKLEYVFHSYDFSNDCYRFRKKYTIMPDGKLFFAYYTENSKKSCYRKTFSVKPSAVRLLYVKVRFLLRHANTQAFFHNGCGSRLKLSYRFKNHEFAYHGLAFGILGSKTPVSKLIILDVIMMKFIRKHCIVNLTTYEVGGIAAEY